MSTRPSLRSLIGLAALVVVIAGGTAGLRAWSHERVARQVAAAARPGDIHMLSSDTCVFCAKARAWFEARGIPFSECSVERDAACAAKYAALLAPGTPVFVVRGRRLVGFDAAALGAALDAQ